MNEWFTNYFFRYKKTLNIISYHISIILTKFYFGKMRSEAFVDKMKSIQNSLLEFLEDESDANGKYENFINLISTQKINNEEYEFKALLQLINHIGNNHHRVLNFISKIERVLKEFKQELQKSFSNSEIFDIFKDNKRILLFLLEEKMMIIDEYIFSIITSDFYVKKNYCEYFQPEIKPFVTQENIEKYSCKNKSLKDDKFIERMNKEIEANFYEKRRKGENDDYLCELIRFDEIQEFVRFVEQTNLPLEDKIKKSIFETNQFFVDKSNVTMLEYASFFGSIKIIQYLIRKTKIVNSKIWIYSIHANNVKMIHLLEDYQIELDLQEILRESIECYHNNISNYIINNLIKEEDLQNDIDIMTIFIDMQLNIKIVFFFPTNMKYKNMFLYLCEFDYYTLVKLYLKELAIDINVRIKTLII